MPPIVCDKTKVAASSNATSLTKSISEQTNIQQKAFPTDNSENTLQMSASIQNYAHSIGNSSASRFSSSSLSPTNTANPVQNISQTSSPSNSSTNDAKNLSPNNNNRNGTVQNVSSNSNITPPNKTVETVTPINSRFIIKKIPQAELEKYITPAQNKNTNNLNPVIQASEVKVKKQLTNDPMKVKEESPDNAGNLSSDPTKQIVEDQPIKKENTERRINKFTVKKVR